jgi:hypothetical protein
MKGFRNKQEFEQWAVDQFTRYGIRQPDTYSEQELVDLNPAVPADFIRQHVKTRDKVAE